MIDTSSLPISVFSGTYDSKSHVQGIATDGKYMYFSFTTFLLKTDLNGNAVGSVDGFTGHLGCIAYDDGFIYGSLEYKNDAIGTQILKKLDAKASFRDTFFAVRFDADKITRMHMNALDDNVLKGVGLSDVYNDYTYENHRYGCSGIDGITVCKYTTSANSVFVAYGIYGDINRTDNDNQIILRFDADKLNSSLMPLCPDNPDRINTITADEKIFIYTGNTEYGIQNLEYDPYMNKLIAAVYPGKKPQFENHRLFLIDLEAEHTQTSNERRYGINSVHGCDFPLGSTGIIALGGGYYYFSEDGKNSDGYFTYVKMYKKDTESFSPVYTKTANKNV